MVLLHCLHLKYNLASFSFDHFATIVAKTARLVLRVKEMHEIVW